MQVGGPYWDVPVGRKDAKTTSLELANADIPSPDQGLIPLITKFLEKGLSVTDMVALSGMQLLLLPPKILLLLTARIVATICCTK